MSSAIFEANVMHHLHYTRRAAADLQPFNESKYSLMWMISSSFTYSFFSFLFLHFSFPLMLLLLKKIHVMANEDENGTSTFGVSFKAEGYIFLTEHLNLYRFLFSVVATFRFFFLLHFPQNPVCSLIELPMCMCIWYFILPPSFWVSQCELCARVGIVEL